MRNIKGRQPASFLVLPPQQPTFVVPANLKVGACQTLDNILMLFGSKGQNWIKGDEYEHTNAGEYSNSRLKVLRKAFDGFCLIGGVKKVDGQYEGAARVALALAITQYHKPTAEMVATQVAKRDSECISALLMDEYTIISFNDDSKVKFSDIRAVVKLAKKLIQEAPTAV